MEFNVT
ncbi:galactose-1-phosphate uridylyltransferase like protein, partial [Danaus plexippus plexippus]